MRLDYKALEQIRNYTPEKIYDEILNSISVSTYTSFSDCINHIYFQINISYNSWVCDFMPFSSKLRQYFKKERRYHTIETPKINWRLCEEYIKENETKVQNDMSIFLEQAKQEISFKKGEIIKLIEKRKKQIFRSKKVTEKSQSKKQELMKKMASVLLGLGYQVSKVVSKGYYYEISVSERQVADKYHKYIESEKNIKFATIEVKINTKSYSIGIKLQTTGQIGCLYEDFIKMEEKITVEYNKLVKALEKIKED